MPSPQPGRFRVGNVLRLAHAPPPSPDQIRLSASLPRFSPRGYEPLSPASPRQPLLSPSSMHPMTPSLPPTPSSPSFSDGGVYSGHTREPGVGTQDGRLLPNTLASIRKRTRLKSCTVFVLVLAALAIAGCIAWSTNLHVPSEQTVRFYASRIGNGLRPWTDSVEPTEQSEPASSAATIPSRPTGPIKAAEEDTVSEFADIPISTLPKLEPPSAADQSVKYLGYLPHSGFHNQRIELQSALLLGKVLNRTVLIPPVWIGWPVPTQYYPDLRDSWTAVMLSTPQSSNTSNLSIDSELNCPISSRTSKDDFPCSDCDADDPSQIAKQQAHDAETRAKWAALGYEVRPDGYPIVPGLTADDCKSYSPECRFTYRDTFLGWDFLVDLDKARTAGSRLASRWDMRERALLAQLRASENDVYILEDRQKYDFRFADEIPASAPLIQANNDTSHWHRDVSIAALQQLPHRILLVGSMHGSDRVRVTQAPEAEAWASTFARSMAFSNPCLMRPADAIVARLGGASNFVAVHARVGDGQFARHARVNMERAWRSLADQLQVRADVAEEMWERVKPAERVATSTTTTAEQRQSRQHRRNLGAKIATRAEGTAADAGAVSDWAELDDPQEESDNGEAAYAPSPKSRQVKRGLLADVLWRAWSGSGNPSDRLRNLTCRGALHTDRRFSAFNTPLYLATDSRTPETDENLAVFFRSFPCTFVLSDFGKPDVDRNDGVVVESVSEMDRLVNELDGVRLGRLFLPFLEAIVAAKARVTVGTERSTFSAFASSDLHDAYHA